MNKIRLKYALPIVALAFAVLVAFGLAFTSGQASVHPANIAQSVAQATSVGPQINVTVVPNTGSSTTVVNTTPWYGSWVVWVIILGIVIVILLVALLARGSGPYRY